MPVVKKDGEDQHKRQYSCAKIGHIAAKVVTFESVCKRGTIFCWGRNQCVFVFLAAEHGE